MYFKVKTYSPAKQSLDSLPLEEFAEDYEDLRLQLSTSYNDEFSKALTLAKERFVRRWNAENESSYEGSFEELDLESKVRASLGNLPDLASSNELAALIESFSSKFALPRNADWFFSQTIAKFAQLPLVKNANGYSAKALVVDHIRKSKLLTALWVLMRYQKRSSLLDKQTSVTYRNYSSLVPIIMSAFKKMNNIPYSAWDRSEIHGITEPNLVKAMMVTEIPSLLDEEILRERFSALTPKSGKNLGLPKNPATTYSLYFTSDSDLKDLPTLARIMVCQTWCAHPSNRTEYMILNPLDWDDMPNALIDVDILNKQVVKDIPWDI